MLHTIKKVEYLDGYKLKLLFDDGKIKVVDFEDRLKDAKNMFLPLKEIDYFQKVESDGTTIVWPNGLDLCPDVLYESGKDLKAVTKKMPSKDRKNAYSRSRNRIAAKSKDGREV